MLIRDERPDDVRCISPLHYVAFKNHPAHAPGAEPVEHRIVERLRASGGLTLSLVVDDGGDVVGHVALSPAVVGEDRHGWFLLGPIGVLPRLQGQGLGSALMRETLRRMREHDALGVVLVGEPAFYRRFGFANVPGLVYPGVPELYVLAMWFGVTVPQGDIVAHEAFAIPAE